MKEQRNCERFQLSLRARVEVISSNGEGEYDMLSLLTRDISSGGAFFNTLQPLSQGTRLKIALVLGTEKPKRRCERYSYVMVKGTVLRAEPAGMAVSFDEGYTNRPPTKIRKRTVRWEGSTTPYVIRYRLYWCVDGSVDFDSDSLEVGNVREIILPDDIPLFPLVTAAVQLGVTAIDDMGNESEMAKATAFFRFKAPEAPTHLVIEDVHED